MQVSATIETITDKNEHAGDFKPYIELLNIFWLVRLKDLTAVFDETSQTYCQEFIICKVFPQHAVLRRIISIMWQLSKCKVGLANVALCIWTSFKQLCVSGAKAEECIQMAAFDFRKTTTSRQEETVTVLAASNGTWNFSMSPAFAHKTPSVSETNPLFLKRNRGENSPQFTSLFLGSWKKKVRRCFSQMSNFTDDLLQTNSECFGGSVRGEVYICLERKKALRNSEKVIK